MEVYISLKLLIWVILNSQSDLTWFQLVLQTEGSDLVYWIQDILIISGMTEYSISDVLLK